MTAFLYQPFQAAQAAIVNQDLVINLAIGYIGSNVPALYSSSLGIGDHLFGSITVSNVDDALDGLQSSGIALGSHQMTIVGESYDLAGSPYSSDTVNVSSGVVDGINYATGSIYSSSTFPFITYQTNGYWGIIFSGWNLSDPLNDRYTITGSYSMQLTSVPVPAAAWLFGTGLLGLIGAARCKKVS